MRRVPLVITATVGLLLATGVAGASPAAPSAQDQAFMAAAGATNLAEISAGTLAQTKGTTSQVRSIGAKLASDHKTAQAQLTSLAAQLGVRLPSAPTPAQQQVAQQLQAASGAAFDTAFLQAMVQGHQEAISAFETEVAQGSDPQVKAWAQATLPQLRMHLQLAQSALGAGTAGSVAAGSGGLLPKHQDRGPVVIFGAVAVALGALVLLESGRRLLRR